MQDLVARAQAGERASFARRYELYAAKIISYLRYHLGHRPDAGHLAEDLAADVFVKVLEKLGGYCYCGAPLLRLALPHRP